MKNNQQSWKTISAALGKNQGELKKRWKEIGPDAEQGKQEESKSKAGDKKGDDKKPDEKKDDEQKGDQKKAKTCRGPAGASQVL